MCRANYASMHLNHNETFLGQNDIALNAASTTRMVSSSDAGIAHLFSTLEKTVFHTRVTTSLART